MSFKSQDLMVTLWGSGQSSHGEKDPDCKDCTKPDCGKSLIPSCGTSTTDCCSKPPKHDDSKRRAATLALLRQQLRETLTSLQS